MAESGTSCVLTSAGISTVTGPGRPLRRRWNARRITLAVISAFHRTSLYTETDSYACAGEKFGRTECWLMAGPPGRYRTGTLSANACARPPMQFSEPGPPCVTITPNFLRLFIRLYPSAAMIALLFYQTATTQIYSLSLHDAHASHRRRQ